MKTIDYYLFPQSPYAYMGHSRFAALVKKYGLQVNVRPMDAAKVFPVSGGLPLSQRPPQRVAYRMTELKRWRDFLQLPINVQPKFFPVPGDPAARLTIAANEISADKALQVAGAFGKAVWEQERNIGDVETQNAVLSECGLDAAALQQRAAAQDIQARYENYSQAAIDAQVFGAPSYIYNGELFWGQDRLDFLERALQTSASKSA